MLMGGNTIQTSLLKCLNQPGLLWKITAREQMHFQVMLNEGVATFGVGAGKENWEHLGSAAPLFYSAAARTA